MFGHVRTQQKPRSLCVFVQSDPCLRCIITESLDTYRMYQRTANPDETVLLHKIIENCAFCIRSKNTDLMRPNSFGERWRSANFGLVFIYCNRGPSRGFRAGYHSTERRIIIQCNNNNNNNKQYVMVKRACWLALICKIDNKSRCSQTVSVSRKTLHIR